MARSKSGFTLVETLVVLAIIAGMIGLLLPAVQRARAAGRKTGCLNNLRQISIAANQHRELSGQFPKPGESWTITLLQWIEERPLMETIRSGNVADTRDRRPPLYECPSQPDIVDETGAMSCHYVLELGSGTPKKRGFSFSDLPVGRARRPWYHGHETHRRQEDDNAGPHGGIYNRL